MPPANETEQRKKLLRSLVWGVEKVRKTSWAMMCAAAGYNVIILDGDDGSLIVDQLPLSPEQKARIQLIDLTMQNEQETVFIDFVREFMKPGANFVWDEQKKAQSTVFPDKTHSHFKINTNLLSQNDVVVLDSWKALAESTLFRYADRKDIDLSVVERDNKQSVGNLRGLFGYQSNWLNYVLARIHALPCHLIVVGHSTVYEKYDQRFDPPKMIEQRTQLISSSGPHAKGIGSNFHDLFYFDRLSSDTVMIDTSGDKDRMGGSRIWPPMKKKWEDFLPEKTFEKMGVKATGAKCEAVKWYRPGEEIHTALSAQFAKSAVVAGGNGSPNTTVGNVTATGGNSAPPVIPNMGVLARLQMAKQQSGVK